MAKRKAAGTASSDLRPIWLPTVDNLHNFFLKVNVEILSFFSCEERFSPGKSNRPEFKVHLADLAGEIAKENGDWVSAAAG